MIDTQATPTVAPVPIDSLVDVLTSRLGWRKLPDADTPPGYAAALIAPKQEEEGALAMAFVQPDTLPLLSLTVRPDREEKDVAALLRIARRVPLPREGDSREMTDELCEVTSAALLPSRVYCIGVYDTDRRQWIGFIEPADGPETPETEAR